VLGIKQMVDNSFIKKQPSNTRMRFRSGAQPSSVARATAARTVEAVCAAIGQLLDVFTPQECANYFKNAGYDPT
jgi:hypothetical protein